LNQSKSKSLEGINVLNKEVMKRYLWILVLLVVSILQGIIPVIHLKIVGSAASIPLIVLMTAVELGLVIWLVIRLYRRSNPVGVQTEIRWYQVALRICGFCVLACVLFSAFMKLKNNLPDSAYSINTGFAAVAIGAVLDLLLYTVILNMFFSVCFYIKRAEKTFWICAGKLLGLSLIPICVITALSMLITKHTGVVLDIIITWLMWVASVQVMLVIKNKIS